MKPVPTPELIAIRDRYHAARRRGGEKLEPEPWKRLVDAASKLVDEGTREMRIDPKVIVDLELALAAAALEIRAFDEMVEDAPVTETVREQSRAKLESIRAKLRAMLDTEEN